MGRHRRESPKTYGDKTNHGKAQVAKMMLIASVDTYTALADILGVSTEAVRQWDYRLPGLTRKMLTNAAEKLKVDIEYITAETIDTAHREHNG